MESKAGQPNSPVGSALPAAVRSLLPSRAVRSPPPSYAQQEPEVILPSSPKSPSASKLFGAAPPRSLTDEELSFSYTHYKLGGQAGFEPVAGAGSAAGGAAPWLRLTTVSSSEAFLVDSTLGKVPDARSPVAQTPGPSSNLSILCSVCMYNEEGYTLARTLQSLAMQQYDLSTQDDLARQRALRGRASGDPPPARNDHDKVHLWLLCDGYSRMKEDGSGYRDILQASATGTALEAYGALPPQGEPDPLLTFLNARWKTGLATKGGDKATVDAGAATATTTATASPPPPQQPPALEDELVLLQYVGPDGRLAPIDVNVEAILRSDSRSGGLEPPLRRKQARRDEEEAGATGAGNGGRASASPVGPRTVQVYFSVLIKRANAQKHNSHRVFFEALSQRQNPWVVAGRCTSATLPPGAPATVPRADAYFCTDVGTLYGPNMLFLLRRQLRLKQECAACCAMQQIMTFSDQAEPWNSKAEPLAESWLRYIQEFDFESGLAVFNGMHAAMRFLPVLPGPCTFLRASAMTPQLLDHMKSLVTSDKSTDGLLRGNLKIAEDRIPSFLVLILPRKDGQVMETHWVPEATFYFESENTLKEFTLQRRRWLNGTLAGYLWLIRNRLLWAGLLTNRMAWRILLLSSVQVVIFALIFISPALLAIGGHLGISGLFALLNAWGAQFSAWILDMVLGFFWVIYAGSFALLLLCGRFVETPFIPWIWYTRLAINAALMLLNAAVLFAFVFTNWWAPDLLVASMGNDIINDVKIVFVGALITTFTPFFLTMMLSIRSFKQMIWSFPYYWPFLPTLLVDFFSYGVSRLDDLSWGTKGATGGGSGDDKKPFIRAHLLTSPETRDARGVRDNRSKRSAWVTNLVLLQLGLFALLVLTNFYLMKNVNHWLIIQGLCTGVISLTIMASSFTYFGVLALRRVLCCEPLQNVETFLPSEKVAEEEQDAMEAAVRRDQVLSSEPRSSLTLLAEAGSGPPKLSRLQRCYRATNGIFLWLDNLLRLALYVVWFLIVACWLFDAINAYEQSIIYSSEVVVDLSHFALKRDPQLYLILALVAGGVYALFRSMIDSCAAPPRKPNDKLDWARLSLCARLVIQPIAVLCGLSAAACVPFLAVLAVSVCRGGASVLCWCCRRSEDEPAGEGAWVTKTNIELASFGQGRSSSSQGADSMGGGPNSPLAPVIVRNPSSASYARRNTVQPPAIPGGAGAEYTGGRPGPVGQPKAGGFGPELGPLSGAAGAVGAPVGNSASGASYRNVAASVGSPLSSSGRRLQPQGQEAQTRGAYAATPVRSSGTPLAGY